MKKHVDNVKVSTAESVFAFLFAVFFVAQIISPSINSRTIYLEIVLMVVNPYFWRWLMPLRWTYSKMIIVISLIGIIALGHAVTALKVSMNIFSATALLYLWDRKLWYINRIIYISILMAFMQLILMAIDVNLAFMIGPQNISNSLWGSFATQTNTNIYDAMGIGIPRAAGLSREAGFLASLIVVAIIHRMLINSKSKCAKLFYLVGYIVSFSKMSLVLIPACLVVKLSKYINKIYFVLWIFLFFAVMLAFWHNETEFLNDDINLTYLSRFGAYDSLWYADVYQLLLGENDLSKIGGISAITEYYGENLYAGLGGWIIYNGLLVFCLFIIFLMAMGINSSGIVLLLLTTINVQPDTNQNFVVYAWFLCMYYFRKKHI